MRRFRLALAALSLLATPTSARADQIHISATLEHDAASAADGLGLDGASLAFDLGVAPDAIPTSSGTTVDPDAFDHASYAPAGSLTLAETLNGALDGVVAASASLMFRSPVDPGADWIEIFAYPSLGGSQGNVYVAIYFADHDVIPGDPLDFFAFSATDPTQLTGSLEIGGGPKQTGTVYDFVGATAVGTLPDAGTGLANAAALAVLLGLRSQARPRYENGAGRRRASCRRGSAA